MKRAITDDEIARWFRDAAVELLAAAQDLSKIQIQGPEAEKEQDLLERVVKILEPCRTPPMARLSGRLQTLQPPKLTPQLLEAIGLRPEDISLLAGRLPLIELSLDKALSRGAESIIEQTREQHAPADLIQRTRLALAKLAALEDFLKIPSAQ